MTEISLTNAFEAEKSSFISRNGENARIVSAIKRILRKLAEREQPQDKRLGFITESTYLDNRKYALLACAYVIHPQSGEVAPFRLFFPGVDAEKPVDESDTPLLLKAVLDELGWK